MKLVHNEYFLDNAEVMIRTPQHISGQTNKEKNNGHITALIIMSIYFHRLTTGNWPNCQSYWVVILLFHPSMNVKTSSICNDQWTLYINHFNHFYPFIFAPPINTERHEGSVPRILTRFIAERISKDWNFTFYFLKYIKKFTEPQGILILNF